MNDQSASNKHRTPVYSRQTNSFIENSIEAGILLCVQFIPTTDALPKKHAWSSMVWNSFFPYPE